MNFDTYMFLYNCYSNQGIEHFLFLEINLFILKFSIQNIQLYYNIFQTKFAVVWSFSPIPCLPFYISTLAASLWLCVTFAVWPLPYSSVLLSHSSFSNFIIYTHIHTHICVYACIHTHTQTHHICTHVRI